MPAVAAAQAQEAMRQDAALGPGISLKKVAASVGFADVTNFRRALKRWTGHGPRADP